MPFFEFATARPSLRSRIFSSGVETLLHGKFAIGDEKRFGCSRKVVQIAEKQNCVSFSLIFKNRSLVAVRSLTAADSACSGQKDDELQLCNSIAADIEQNPLDKEPEVDERERLRRDRISKANKGNTPWNKGRKHNPETLLRIRENTRLAMQNPKVKMKLMNNGHAQSNETRAKIGIGVRIRWEKKHERHKMQETCHFDWQNLIAEAARRGFNDQEEFQWESYRVLDEQLLQEWLEGIEQRRKNAKTVGNRRAPKSDDQRRKISEAISAKWADPEYRNRVCSSIVKYHGTKDRAERKPRTRPVGDGQTGKWPAKGKIWNTGRRLEGRVLSKVVPQRLRSKMPLYKDPLASSKLEKIKQIRAQRVAKEAEKTDAIARAKQFIIEAEKAVEAIERAATRSALAQASLIEARELIAEANRAIENTVNHSPENAKQINGNGVHLIMSNENRNAKDFNLNKFSFHDFINGKEKAVTYNQPNALEDFYGGADINGYSLSLLNDSSIPKNLTQLEPNGTKQQHQIENQKAPTMEKPVTKKWVSGRLVQVREGA